MSCMSALSGATGITPSINRNVPEMGKVVIQTTDQGHVVVLRNDGNDDVFKKPLPRGPGPRVALRQKALDEDTYTSSIQTIIERDFFPELPYLRAKQDFEDAVASRDPVRIREAEKHLRKCALTPLGTSIATPGRFSSGRDSANPTPRPGTASGGGGWGNSPSPAPGTPGPGGSRNGSRAASVMGDEEMEEDEHAAVDKEVLRVTKTKSLDQFCNIYTSEDNRAASELMLEDTLNMEERRRWVYEQAAEHNMRQHLLLHNGPRQEDMTLNLTMSCAYNPDDALMAFIPTTEYRRAEAPEVAMRAPKITNNAATRIGTSFLLNMAKQGQQTITGKNTNATPSRDGGVAASPRVGGFNFLLTPSPAPGVDDAPQFTWGSVDGTPLILPDDDLPNFQPFKDNLQGIDLKEFGSCKVVQGATGKEQMAEKLHRKQVEKSALAAKHTGLGKHAPARSAPGTPQFSAAARALAAKLGKQAGDSTPLGTSLRASYRGTPARTPGRTPGRSAGPGTPRCAAVGPSGPGTPRMATPSHATPSHAREEAPARAGAGEKGLPDGAQLEELLGRGMETEMRERLLRERLLAAGVGKAGKKDVTDGLLEL